MVTNRIYGGQHVAMLATDIPQATSWEDVSFPPPSPPA